MESLRALARHRGRSALTALGIMVGVATVIWVVAVGEAGSRRAEAELQQLGDNFVWIEAGSRTVGGVRLGAHGTTTLLPADAEAIRREVPLVKAVSENVDGSVQVMAGSRNWRTRYRGVAPDYLGIKSWRVAAGDFFTEGHVKHADNVVVLGETVRRQLLGAGEAVGQTIRVANMSFQVVGVLAPKGQTNMGQDQDDTLLMPWTTVQRKLRSRDQRWLDDIVCSAVSMEAVPRAIEELTALLRERHGIRSGEPDDFNVRRPDEAIKAHIESTRTLEVLLVALASISLVVGGIGVMNVMLASVTQRTAEIGVRVAVGAPMWAVRLQFLGEAVMLSLAGGLLGIPLSLTGSFLISRLLGWPIGFPASAAALAITCSAAVGVTFGLYPAWRASSLDPITALRRA